MAERELSILVKAKGALKAAQDIGRVDAKISGLARKGLGNAARNIEKAFVGIGVAAGGAIVGAVKIAGDFEAQMNTINTVAGRTPEQLAAIGDELRALAKKTGTPLEELTTGYYDLVSAGIKAADAQKVLTAANTLAIGGLSTTGEAIDLLTTAINSYGGDASRATEFANSFAQSIASGKVTAAELASSFAQVGPMAAQFGIELDEISAAMGVMTATGTKAPEAFTQIRSALIALQRPTEEMGKLQNDLGVDFAKMAKNKGLAFTYNKIAEAAEKAGIPMIKLTGRVEGSLFAAQVAGDNYAKYTAELEKVHHASDGAGVAAEQMAQRQQGLNFQIGRLREMARDAAITIGSKLIPKLVPLMDKLAKFVESHQEDISKFGDSLALGLENVGKFASTVDWAGVGAGLKIGAEGAKTLIGAFLNAPPWLQGFLLTGFAANKFTGGALGGIVGELGKGLIKGVLGMTAGVVNIKAGVVNGAGGAGGAGGGVGAAVGAGVILAAGAQGVMDAATIAQGVGQAYNAYEKGDAQGMIAAQKGIFDQVVLFPPGLTHLGQLITGQQTAIVNAERTAADKVTTKVEGMKGQMVQATQRAADRSTNAAERTKSAIVQAIRTNRPIVKITVPITVRSTSSGTYVKQGSTLVRVGGAVSANNLY